MTLDVDPRIDVQLRALKFETNFNVKGRASIPDLIPMGRRCGIYVLHFRNGEYYVGQAVDVNRRFVQHRQTYDDISHISFKQVARSRLNEMEGETIRTLERAGLPLRNIALVSVRIGETDFDLIMPQDDQERWLSDVSYIPTASERWDDLISDVAIKGRPGYRRHLPELLLFG